MRCYHSNERVSVKFCNAGGGELGDELRKEIQSLRVKVDQLESELQNKNDEIKRLINSGRSADVQVSLVEKLAGVM